MGVHRKRGKGENPMGKLLIIQPTFYVDAEGRILHKSKRRSLVGLSLPYLAAITPRGWDIELIDEQLQDIDFKARADVVAITTWTINWEHTQIVEKNYFIKRSFRFDSLLFILC